MKIHNPHNERIKRQYFVYLKEAKRHSEDPIDGVAKALNRFETYTKFRDFKAFHSQQAVAFKKQLAEQQSVVSGEKLSKATLNATLARLKRELAGVKRERDFLKDVAFFFARDTPRGMP